MTTPNRVSTLPKKCQKLKILYHIYLIFPFTCTCNVLQFLFAVPDKVAIQSKFSLLHHSDMPFMAAFIRTVIKLLTKTTRQEGPHGRALSLICIAPGKHICTYNTQHITSFACCYNHPSLSNQIAPPTQDLVILLSPAAAAAAAHSRNTHICTV